MAEERKTHREIAKDLHISLNDIGKIIRNHTGDDKDDLDYPLPKDLSVESKCYKMFKEGKGNVDIAIALNIPAKDVMDYHLNYQRLLDMDDFIKLYRELGGDLRLFVFLYNRMKDEDLLNRREISNLVNVECKLRDLSCKIDMECQELGRLNLQRLDLIDQIRAMGGVALP
jgi:hypothetical protein